MSKEALSGQVVVVIGAGGLLGRRFVEGIAEAGGKVIAADINLDAAEKTVSMCKGAGYGAVIAAAVDIGDAHSIDSLLETGERDHGRIHAVVNSAYPRFDIYGQLPMTMPVEYAAIKSGIIHLSRYFAQYYKQDGVRVNCISPGGILDGQPDEFLRGYGRYAGTKGMLDPTDVVGSLIFLLSEAACRMTGQNLVVDDGFSL